MFLFVAAALAQDTAGIAVDSVAACHAAVVDSYPLPNAAGVPLDAQPALVIRTNCPGMSTTVGVYREDTGQLVLQREEVLSGYWSLSRLAPPALLLPDTLYSVQVFGEYTGVSWLAFTTGSDVATPFSGDPEVRHADCERCGGDSASYSWAELTLRVWPVPDPHHGSVLVAYSKDKPDEPAGFVIVADYDAIDVRVGIEQGHARERECFTVVQTDAANREVGRSERSCAAVGPPRSCGCSSGAREPSLLGSLGVLLLRRRRGARAPVSAAG